MTKHDLEELLYIKFSDLIQTKKNSSEIVKFLFSTMTNRLFDHEDIVISGFGKFVIVDRPARQGINPQTKEKIEIPARKALKFQQFSTLKKGIQKK